MDAQGAAREPRGAGPSHAQERPDLFRARPGGLAEAVGTALGARRPLVAALVVWIAAFVVLGAAIIGFGLLLTRASAGAGLDAADGDVVRWFVDQRTPAFDAVTWLGSHLGSTGVILAVSGVAGIVLALGRHWRQFGFLLIALTLEFSLFLLTVTVVSRSRPDVLQLDAAPPTSSFPSGHTAASVTLYVGLAVVTRTLVRSRWARTLAWAAGIAIPLLVAVSRMYRGMHFPTDVTAAALLAGAALLVAVFAVRCTTAAADRRPRAADSERPESGPPPDTTIKEMV